MATVNCSNCENVNCLIRLCSMNCIHEIEHRAPLLKFRKDQIIFEAGTPVLGIYFIRQGKVKVFANGLNGKEQIVRLGKEGDLLGHRGSKNEVYPINATTIEDTILCFLGNDLLNQLFLINPTFLVEMMMYYSGELRKLEHRIKNLTQMNTREKIADALVLMTGKFGLEEGNELNVIFSREDFANIAGTTRQQLVAQLTDFEEDGLIQKRGKKIAILKLDELRKITMEFNAGS